MDPVMLGMAVDFGTSLLGGKFSSNSAKAANKQAENLQNRQALFTEYMSNTAHQRQVKDLKEAGLNPILSATGGSGAGGGTVSLPPVIDEGNAGLNSAMALRKLSAEIKNMHEQNANIKSSTELNKAAEQSQKAEALLRANSAKNVAATTKVIEAGQAGRDVEEAIDKSKYGKIMRYLGRLNPFASMANSAASAASKLLPP